MFSTSSLSVSQHWAWQYWFALLKSKYEQWRNIICSSCSWMKVKDGLSAGFSCQQRRMSSYLSRKRKEFVLKIYIKRKRIHVLLKLLIIFTEIWNHAMREFMYCWSFLLFSRKYGIMQGIHFEPLHPFPFVTKYCWTFTKILLLTINPLGRKMLQ